MTRAVVLAILTTGALLASAPAHGSAPDGPINPDLPGEQLHLLGVEHTSSGELNTVVAVPVRFDGAELTSHNFGLSSTYAEGHTLHPATDVAHLTPDTMELLLLLDDSSGVSNETLIAQQGAVVELVREMEPGVSFLVASTTRGVLSPTTADPAAALAVLADLHATTAPMDLALLSATTPAITPPMRRAVFAFDHDVDHVQLVAQTLKNDSARSVPTFIVVLDGAPSANTSEGSITVITAPSNRLVAIVDRVAASISRQYRVSFAVGDPLPSAADIVVTVGAVSVQVPVLLVAEAADATAETRPATADALADPPPAAAVEPAEASSAPGPAAPIAEADDCDVVAAASRAPPSAPARLGPAKVDEIELKTQVWELRSWWLFAAFLLVAALSFGVVGVLRSSAGAIPMRAVDPALRRSGDRDVQVSPPTGRTTILVPARAETAPDAPSHDEDEMPGAAAATPFYVSADSAPAGYAVRRSPLIAPLFLVCYLACCAAIVPLLPALTSFYGRVLAQLTGVSAATISGSTLSFRPLFIFFVALLSIFAPGSRRERTRALGISCSLVFLGFVASDLMLAVMNRWLAAPLSASGGMVTSLLALPVMAVVIFSCFRLPEGVRVSAVTRQHRERRRMLIVCGASAAIVALFLAARHRYFRDFRIKLLGGLDSEFVLVLMTVVFVLAALSAWDRRNKPTAGPVVSVAFLVPAYNEAASIEDCIRAIDDVAAHYAGPCSLYVVDNMSKDDTGSRARTAIESCRALSGRVLVCPRPGKSHALNYGLAHITEDIIVRIDADTRVESDLLERATPWFWDRSIGGVSGLPFPKPTRLKWLFPLRLIEVYYGVAFLRVAQSAVDGVMVMPGLVACYRRAVLSELGGFGEGFNGEDADVTMRIGRLGYRIVTDPTIRVWTEVPETIAHLREQRQRWARGLFHMGSRNLSAIWMRQGTRGVWILPWSIVNGIRRLIMIPVLLAAMMLEVLAPTMLSLREISVVAGFVIGLQVVVITGVMLVARQFKAILAVPLYALFRLFRAYVAFEMILTLRLRTIGIRHPDGDGRAPDAQEPEDSAAGQPASDDDVLLYRPFISLLRR